MKKIQLIILIIGYTSICLAQCDGFDPNSPLEHTTSVWDWRDDSPNNWIAYVPNESNIGVEFYLDSPFEPNLFYDDNVNDLYVNSVARDYQPEDGWELVFKAFGFGASNYVKNPGFVLYNRFTGMLRTFIYVRTDLGEGATDGVLTINFTNDLEKASAALTFVQSKTKALDNFTQNEVANTSNVYNNSNFGEWFRSDLIVAYDPCTCSSGPNAAGVITPNLSQLVLKPQLIDNGELCLISPTALSATNNCIVENGVFNNNGVKPVYSSIPANLKQSGNKTSSDLEALFSELAIINEVLNPELFGQNVKLKELGPMKEIITLYPNLNYVFTILNFIVAGGNKTTNTKPAIANQTAVTSYQGNLSSVYDTDGFAFYTPGSPHESITDNDDTNKPIYDYVLGVMNMLETPKLEYVQYNCDEDHFPVLVDLNSESTSFCQVNADMPQLWQFRLSGEPKFAVNPASELELIDMEYALDYRLHKNQGEVDNSSLGSTNAIGDDHQSKRTIGGIFNQCGNLFVEVVNHYPMLGPVFMRESASGLPYETKLIDQGIYLTSWPKPEGSATGTDRMDFKTFSTGFFPAQCWSEQSFIFAHHPLNYLDPTDFSYGNDARYYYKNLEITLRVKAVFRRTDSEADELTEEILMITSYQCDWSASPLNLPFSNSLSQSHTYEINSNQLMVNPGNSFNMVSEFGSDYFVEFLNDKNNPGHPVFNIGNAAFPFNDYIVENVIFNHLDRRASRNVTYVNNAELTCPNGAAEVIANQEIIISGNSIVSSDITLKLGYVSACENNAMPLPMSPASILASHCPNLATYNPNLPRSYADGRIPSDHEQELTEHFAFAPNPASESTSILYRTKYERINLSIFSLTGQLVMQQVLSNERQIETLQLNALSSGLYTVKLTNAENETIDTLMLTKL